MAILVRQRLVVAAWAVVGMALLATMVAAEKKPKQTTTHDLRPISEIRALDVVGMVLMAIGLTAASAGGVGGGPILVPILIIFMGFDIKFATPISNFIIMGGAVANAIFNLQKRHPYADRPLVDADICMAMIPSMMGGAVIGAFLSKLLPSYVVSTLLVLLMAVAGRRTMLKGFKLHKAEREKKQAEELVSQQNKSSIEDFEETVQSPVVRSSFRELKSPGSADVQLTIHEHEHETTDKDGKHGPLAESRAMELETLLQAERQTNWKKHGFIVVCYLGILAATIRGAAIECGSVGYWVLLWAEIPWVLLFTCIFVVVMRREQAYKRELDFPKAVGDLEWTNRTVLLFPMACMFAGIVASVFGIGGAIITGPLMIEMGVLPEVASSSSALLVLYSSAAATAKFALFDLIAYDWGGWLCGLAFVVTSIAQVFIGGFVRRTGRQSIIVFCIGFTICVGGVLMVYSTVRTYINDAGEPFHVQLCPASRAHDGK